MDTDGLEPGTFRLRYALNSPVILYIYMRVDMDFVSTSRNEINY